MERKISKKTKRKATPRVPRRKMRGSEKFGPNQELFAKVFHASPLGILISELAEERFLEVNAAMLKLLGYSRAEIVGHRSADLNLWVDYPDRAHLTHTLEPAQVVCNEEIQYRTRAGDVRAAMASIALIDWQGKRCLITLASDITERKRAEEELRRREERFRRFFEVSLEGIFVHDHGKIVDANPVLCELSGYSLEELIGMNGVELVAPAYRARIAENIRSDTEHMVEADVLRKDGSVVTVEIRPRIIPYHGRTLRAATLSDVTERKRAEGELQATRDFLQQVVDTSPSMIFVKDENNRAVFANRVMAEYYQIPPDQLIQKTTADVHQVIDEAQEFTSDDQDVLKFRKPIVREERNTSPRGEEHWFHTVKVPLVRPDGSTHVLGIATDITDRKRAEENVRQSGARAAALARIAGLLNARLDLETVLKTVCEQAARALDVPATSVALLDEKDNSLLLAATFGLPLEYRERFIPIARDAHDDQTERKGAISVIPDIRTERKTANADLLVALNGRTVLIANLLRENTLVGTLGIITFENVRQFTDDELTLLKGIADQAAQAIANARLLTQTEKRAEEFAALYEIAHDLTLETELPILLQKIVERAAVLFGASGGTMYLFNSEQRYLEIAFTKNSEVPVGTRLELGEGLAGRVAQTRQAMIINDYGSWEGRSPKFQGTRFGAVLEVPMLYRGELIGVLSAREDRASHRKFAAGDVHLLGLFAGHAASAVHNARLHDETMSKLAELEAVNKISTALRVAQTLEEMLPILLDETLGVFGTDAGAIRLFDPAQHTLREFIVRGWFSKIIQSPVLPSEGISATVYSSGHPYVSREFANDEHLRESARHEVPSGWGGVCVPIRTAREIVGVFYVSVQLPRELTSYEVRLLTTLAEIAGNAIQRTRLNHQTERRLQHLTALSDIDRTITSSVDLRLILATLINYTTAQLGVDAADILLYNSDSQMLEYAAGRGFRTQAIERTRLRIGEGYAGRAVLERRMISIPNRQADPPNFMPAINLTVENFASYYAVPLIAKGQIKGVLEIFHRATLSPDPEWLGFLDTLAGQAAIAIDNAKLYGDLHSANLGLAMAYDSTLEGWSRALDLRDKETEGHTRRVTELSLRLARQMGVKDQELVHMRRGGLLHDIGKMGVPDSILLKAGPLTDEEWKIMHQHPLLAYKMLSPIQYLHAALDIPYCHHEKWDGTGYPRGLRGEEIPLAARIFAVIDVWDALISDRPYRPAWTKGRTREYIQSMSGMHFDPKVVEEFLKMAELAV